MKTIKLEVQIECGETTCAIETGKFCGYFGSRKFGQEHVCTLFNKQLFKTVGPDKWVARCPECLEKAK